MSFIQNHRRNHGVHGPPKF